MGALCLLALAAGIVVSTISIRAAHRSDEVAFRFASEASQAARERAALEDEVVDAVRLVATTADEVESTKKYYIRELAVPPYLDNTYAIKKTGAAWDTAKKDAATAASDLIDKREELESAVTDEAVAGALADAGDESAASAWTHAWWILGLSVCGVLLIAGFYLPLALAAGRARIAASELPL